MSHNPRAHRLQLAPAPRHAVLWLVLLTFCVQCLGALPPELAVRRHVHEGFGEARTSAGRPTAHPEAHHTTQQALPFRSTIKSFELRLPWLAGTSPRAHAHGDEWHVHDDQTAGAAPLGEPGDDAASATACWIALLSVKAGQPAIDDVGRCARPPAERYASRSAVPALPPPRIG